MNKTETLLSLAIALATVFVGNSPALAHGKGLYSTEAEAQARADDLAVRVSIKTMGNGCLVKMNENCTNNYASNEIWSPDPAKSTTHPQVVGTSRCSTAFAYGEHMLALQPPP